MENTCASCGKAVYTMELLKCIDQSWHRTCFKCQTCGTSLNVKNYKAFDKKPFCNVHYPQTKAYTFVTDNQEIQRVKQNTAVISAVSYTGRKASSTHSSMAVVNRRLSETPTPMVPQHQPLQQQSSYQPGSINDFDPETHNTADRGLDPKAGRRGSTIFASTSLLTRSDSRPHDALKPDDVPQSALASTPEEVPQSFTEVQSKGPQEVPKSQAVTPETKPEEIPQPQADTPEAKPEEIPQPQADTPEAKPEEITKPQADTPEAKPEEIPKSQADTPEAKPKEIPKSQADTPEAKPEEIPKSQADTPEAKPEEIPKPQADTPEAKPEEIPKSQADTFEAKPEEKKAEPEFNHEEHSHPEPFKSEAKPVVAVKPAGPLKRNRGLCYRAQFDYTAQDSDEVTFSTGDIITNVDAVDACWVYGIVERTGRCGLLPASYLVPEDHRA